MNARRMLLIVMNCILLGTVSIGSMAQNPPIAAGPEEGMSTMGASILPAALPRIQAIPEDVPRGDLADLAVLKRRLPLEPLPRVPEDQSARIEERRPYAPTLTTNFEGIGITGSFPPDPVIAAGPSHLIQAVNRSFRISSKTGTTLSTRTFASWWSSVITGVSPFDPKVLYDQHDDRWVLLTVARNTSTQESWYLISTSHTSDPTGPWCVWALDADVDGSISSTNWADYPQLGLDDQAFYVTSNQFSFSGDFPRYSKLRVMDKAQFYNNTCGPITWSDFWDMRDPLGVPIFTLQPAHTFGTPGKEYLVSAIPILGTAVILWSVTNPTAIPTLTREAALPVGFYTLPPDAEQLGSSVRIDTGDARLMNAVFRDGSLYTAHTVSCFLSYACARYLRIDVAGPSVTLDQIFGASGFYYFYPVIMPDPSGNIVTVFNRSSASEFAGIRYTSRRTTDSAFQESAVLKAGEASYVLEDSLGRNRWGDYNGIALDPTDTTQVWIYSEFADTPANTWGTWAGEVDATSGEPPGPCPVSTALRGAPERRATLETVYRLRDKVLTQSPEGRRYIRLFYRHAREGSRLLLRHPDLHVQTRAVLARLRPTLQAVAEGQPALLTSADVAALEDVMEAFSVEASPQFQRTIRQLRSKLHNGELWSLFRIGLSSSR